MKTYTHESEKLNAMLNKRVKMTDFDGYTYIGKLEREIHKRYTYKIFIESRGYYIAFCKSHVRFIEVIE